MTASDEAISERAAKFVREEKMKPGAALHRARIEIAPHMLSDVDRLKGHVGKRIQFTFHRQLLIGTLVHFDERFKKVVIEYTLGETTAEFRCPIKSLGKIGFLKE